MNFGGNAGASSGGNKGPSGVTWWIIAVAVIAGVAAIAVGILAAFLVKRKRRPHNADLPLKGPEALLKVGPALICTPLVAPLCCCWDGWADRWGMQQSWHTAPVIFDRSKIVVVGL